jgi:hypothetical protein
MHTKRLLGQMHISPTHVQWWITPSSSRWRNRWCWWSWRAAVGDFDNVSPLSLQSIDPFCVLGPTMHPGSRMAWWVLVSPTWCYTLTYSAYLIYLLKKWCTKNIGPTWCVKGFWKSKIRKNRDIHIVQS